MYLIQYELPPMRGIFAEYDEVSWDENEALQSFMERMKGRAMIFHGIETIEKQGAPHDPRYTGPPMTLTEMNDKLKSCFLEPVQKVLDAPNSAWDWLQKRGF